MGDADQDRSECPSIVGIGASAGGIEAIRSFFAALPRDLGHAYVVILHLSPNHRSDLAIIIDKSTQMPVTEVANGMSIRLAANHVYVISPDRQLEISNGSIQASKFEKPRGQRRPIDTLFDSLAKSKVDGFCVVLSGSGSDGLLGAVAVHEQGGIILVQDPEEAIHPGMPMAIISAGVSDVVLPVRQLAERLGQLTETRRLLFSAGGDTGTEEDDTRTGIDRILRRLKLQTGHDFSRYKRGTILRRIKRRMQLRQSVNFGEYLATVEANAKELEDLLRDLLISVTMFFRDPEVWAALAKKVIEPLVANADGEQALRIWVPGCATGEEAYSIAMLFREQMMAQKILNDLVIFASDVDEEALAVAREGRYPAAACANMPEDRLKGFFRHEGDYYRVNGELRDCVVFAAHNLLRDPPFSGLHLVSCRNVMIYFNRDLQLDVQRIFHYACRDDGFLLLGTSETADEDLYRPLDKSARIYKARKLSASNRRFLPDFVQTPSLPTRATGTAPGRSNVPVSEVHLELLERHSPASVLIDESLHVVHLSESVGRYLEHRGGHYERTILDLVRPELKEELREALETAARTHDSTMTMFVEVSFNGTSRNVAIVVQPQGPGGDRDDLRLIFFLDGGPPSEPQKRLEERDTDHVISLLRDKLARSQRRLDRTIEEKEEMEQDLRAGNEELQSLNEEYRSTTEELETSKEELQSVNEELQTVNSELKLKLEEVSQAHNDLENLMVSTNIATLFVDRDLAIKRFTPRLAELFSVKSADVGRPISDFTHQLAYDRFAQDAESVLQNLTQVEKKIRTRDGRVVLIRMRPYRTADDRIEGTVITFLDITTLQQTQEALETSEQNLADELAITKRLHRMILAVATAGSMRTVLQEIIAAAMEILRADFGSVHFLREDGSGDLILAEHLAVPAGYLEHLRVMETGADSVFSAALRSQTQYAIEDVQTMQAHHPRLDIEPGDLFSALLVQPLIEDGKRPMGLLSLYFNEPRAFSGRDYDLMEFIAYHATQMLLRRRQQDELGSLIEELRQRTAQLEANEQKLSAQAEVLRAQDKARQDFISILGHELRNPLAAIQNSIDLLNFGQSLTADHAQPSGDDAVARAFSVLDRQSRHMRKLVDDLLDISRMERGKLDLKLESVNLCQIIVEVVNAMRPRFESRSIELTVDIPDRPVRLIADPERVIQMLDNLLRNSSTYTNPGGSVTVKMRPEDDFASIQVSDTGIGIQPEVIKQLFEPYQQIERMSRDGGLGLGLTLVKQLVDMHAGTVTAESEGLGKGSIFTLRLPLADYSSETIQVDSLTGGNAPEQQRILVVDDKMDNANALADILQRLGQEVKVAYSGEQALEKLANYTPQIAFLDVSMPTMDGYELARRIHKLYRNRRVTLVALTGHPYLSEPELFDHHLLKPIDVTTVIDLIRSSGRAVSAQS